MGAVLQTVPNQRIRGPHLAVLIPRNVYGPPFEEGLQRANDAGRVIASNKRLDTVFRGDGWRTITEAFTAWSGTMVAYTTPGKKLGTQIVYVDSVSGCRWVFPVPPQHKDKKDAILVAEHPRYTLEVDGRNRVIHAEETDLVEGFPVSPGCYLTDRTHGLPTGTHKISSSKNRRFLHRIEKRVGPVARLHADPISGYYGTPIGDYRRTLFLDPKPSAAFGIIVESASLETTKKI